jgi:NAD(P)H dehydrogenase (quinone)
MEDKMKKVLILFHSQEYMNTKKMAEAIGEGVANAGAEAVLVNTNERRIGMEEYGAFDAVCFGSPDYYSYLAGGIKMFLDDWYIAKGRGVSNITDKPYGLFYSHGGGGAVRGPLEKLFIRTGRKVGETVESRGAPDESELAECRNLGAELARSVSTDAN